MQVFCQSIQHHLSVIPLQEGVALFRFHIKLDKQSSAKADGPKTVQILSIYLVSPFCEYIDNQHHIYQPSPCIKALPMTHFHFQALIVLYYTHLIILCINIKCFLLIICITNPFLFCFFPPSGWIA